MNLKYLDIFSRNTQISIFTEIRPVGAELVHADRRTDMTKPIVASRNSSKAPKKKHTPTP